MSFNLIIKTNLYTLQNLFHFYTKKLLNFYIKKKLKMQMQKKGAKS